MSSQLGPQFSMKLSLLTRQLSLSTPSADGQQTRAIWNMSFNRVKQLCKEGAKVQNLLGLLLPGW